MPAYPSLSRALVPGVCTPSTQLLRRNRAHHDLRTLQRLTRSFLLLQCATVHHSAWLSHVDTEAKNLHVRDFAVQVCFSLHCTVTTASLLGGFPSLPVFVRASLFSPSRKLQDTGICFISTSWGSASREPAPGNVNPRAHTHTHARTHTSFRSTRAAGCRVWCAVPCQR